MVLRTHLRRVIQIDMQGTAVARRQLKLFPTSTSVNGNLGSVLVFTHHWDQAIEQLRYAIDFDPNYWFEDFFLGQAYEQKQMYPEAIAAFQRGLKLEESTELWASLGHAYAVSGGRVEAQRVLDHLTDLATYVYVAPYHFAVIYAGLGDKDRAFEWLLRAYEARSYLLAIYLNTDARVEALRRRVDCPARRREVSSRAPPARR